MRIGFLLFAVLAFAAKDKKDIPKAPLPAALVNAKRVFISKGVGATAFTVEGGFDLAFDAFYADMKSWGRYELTDKPEVADLIMAVSYTASGTPHVYSTTNTYTHETNVNTSQVPDLQLSLVVFDSHTKMYLWSTSVAPGLARLKHNQQKEMVKAGKKLMSNLKMRIP